ncbi:MAG: DUF4386 domain-containing protein [Candidatus Marinimicrobia bacterium]|nr:DUF4386 domain-containing protein [Candidatus Neomarinimicrobiota bacterium]
MIPKEELNPNKTARIAGFLYVLMIPLGLFGIMYVPTLLIVDGDAVTTTKNIMDNIGMFRLSIVTALIVQVIHISIVLLLYRLLKPVNKNIALLMVVFMLVSVPIAMLNELNRFAIPLFLSGAADLKVFTTVQLQALVPMLLDLHENGILIASIFWGLWLFPMGYLVFKSGFISKIPGVLLIIAGSGYLIDTFARLLSPNYGTTIIATIITVTLYGELVFAIWLLIKGVNIEQWEKRALESARV